VPTFYRILKTNPPTEADFLSYAALGRPLRRDTPELRRSWEGVSTYDTLDAARAIVANAPRIGRFIAELEIGEDGPVAFEQSGADPSHFDLFGTAADMLSAVRRVLPV
jgi:hypothetical protein